jgi:uncharacterized protein (DUF849 family)
VSAASPGVKPVIISAAITGGMTVPSQSPHIPVTPEEIARSAIEAAEAGAAIVHIHVREPDGRPSARPELFEEVYGLIRGGCDAIVQTTTGGGVGMTIEERARVVPLVRPEMATFNMGSFNFAIFTVADRISEWRHDWERDYVDGTREYVFKNTFADIEHMAGVMREHGVKPELEVYDLGHLYTVLHFLERGLLDPPVHIQFVLGVLGAIGARAEELMHLHQRAQALLGEHSWSVAGIGYSGQFRLAAISLALGGHIRVGLEDNLRVRPGELATSNAALVERAVRLARELDREPAHPDEARGILGVAPPTVARV